MNRTLVLALSILLAGCLGGTPDGDPEAGPPDGGAEPGPGGSDESADTPGTSGPSDDIQRFGNPLEVGLEGIDCDMFIGNVRGSGEPAARRAPEGVDVLGNSTVAVYYNFAQHCSSVVLEDRLQEDVWISIVEVAVLPPEDAPTADVYHFVLETFTNWPYLHEAWLDHGVESRLAVFDSERTDEGSRFSIEADGISYAYEAPAMVYMGVEGESISYVLYVDATNSYYSVLAYPERDNFNDPGFFTGEGGVVSEATQGAGAIQYVTGKGSITLRENVNGEKND